MLNPGAVVVGVLALVLLVAGLGAGAGGVGLLRRASRTARERVPVEAVCVERTHLVQPARVTLDHPVPGGWRRVTLVEGLPTRSVAGGTAGPGDRVTVWVDPRQPQDVRLSPGSSAGSVGGVLLLGVGLLLCAGAALLVGVAVVAVRA